MGIYQSSRWSKGNRLFPDRIALKSDAVVFKKRHLIGGEEETIRYEQIASVSVQRGVFFADVMFETTGGSEPVILTGLWRSTASRAKAELDARVRAHSVSKEDMMLVAMKEQTQILRQILAAVQK